MSDLSVSAEPTGTRREPAPSAYHYQRESWQSLWPEARSLGEAHFTETDEGVESRRPYHLDAARMVVAYNHGLLLPFTARHRLGKLVGYLFWQPSLDLESQGLRIATMGPFYVKPGCWGVALRLFEFSVRELQRFGVQMIFPHHRLQGRGRNLGRWLERRGAKPIQLTYSLWIGED